MFTLVVNGKNLSQEMVSFLNKKSTEKMYSVLIAGLQNIEKYSSMLREDIVFFCEDSTDDDYLNWDNLQRTLCHCQRFEKIVVIFEHKSGLNDVQELLNNPKIEFCSIYEKRSKSVFAHF